MPYDDKWNYTAYYGNLQALVELMNWQANCYETHGSVAVVYLDMGDRDEWGYVKFKKVYDFHSHFHCEGWKLNERDNSILNSYEDWPGCSFKL